MLKVKFFYFSYEMLRILRVRRLWHYKETIWRPNFKVFTKLFHLKQSRLRDQYDWSVPQIHLLKIDLEVKTAQDGIAWVYAQGPPPKKRTLWAYTQWLCWRTLNGCAVWAYTQGPKNDPLSVRSRAHFGCTF